jgi:hypothetical protein
MFKDFYMTDQVESHVYNGILYGLPTLQMLLLDDLQISARMKHETLTFIKSFL